MTGQHPVYRLQVTTQFSSSHQLRNYGGKCEELHGHNFTVQAEVEGTRLEPDTGILIDFKVLKTKLNQVVDPLDHTHLNELPQFADLNPSSENLARHIYQELGKTLTGTGVKVRKVSVSEKESSTAVYMEAAH
jgi:6-pyruvoyltetrahydropterin/6-carboxytetrahydropterin synthase